MAKTLDQTIEALERREKGKGYGSWIDDLHDAVRYLKELRQKQTIEEMRAHEDDASDAVRYAMMCLNRNQPKLSWLQLQERFQKPVYFVKNDDQSRKGWIIVYELHITECGQFVLSTDERLYSLDDYKFYEREFE